MTDRFRLTKPAIQDIEEIADYIAQQSGLEQSERFLSKLESKFSKILLSKCLRLFAKRLPSQKGKRG
jgi:plasmid stabilization system protein ParE